MNISLSTCESDRSPGLAHYDGPDVVEEMRRALSAAGLDPDALEVDDLATLDEFHALGRPATVALAELAGVQAGQRVLDVGAGIGGPGRVLAARYGARVTALDGTPRFCRAAELLNRSTGLSNRVEVVLGDALSLPFEDGRFDLSWTQAVSQNIPDKAGFVSELARVVRPGGRVALFEVLEGPGGDLEFPVPWADGEDQSWLIKPEALRALLEDLPLEVVAWREGPQVLEAVTAAAPGLRSPAGETPLGLHVFMPDFEARMAGLARNVAAGKITLAQVVAQRV